MIAVGALALSAVLAGASDDVMRIGVDGSVAWSVKAVRDRGQTPQAVSPLAAPVWFARYAGTKIPLVTNESFDLASARGKVVLLDYWASWCAPCVKELPHLEKLHAARSGDGLVAVAINADENAATATQSAKRLGLTMRIGINAPDVYRTLGIRSLPTLLLIDREGRLRARWDGYKTGLEKDVEAMVDRLLAGNPTGTTREVASVMSGGGALMGRWSRDLPTQADGVVGLPPGQASGTRVVVSSGDELLSFDADGEAVARLKTQSSAGRLLDLGISPDGTRQLAGFRPGATSVGVIALRSGTEQAMALPAPVLDAAVSRGPAGDSARLVFATLSGAAVARPGDPRAAAKDGAATVRAVAPGPGGLLALHEDGSLSAFDGSSPAWAHPVPGASRLLASLDGAAVVAPRSVIASVAGRFLAGDGRQLAVATYAGRLMLLDEATGSVLFDADWTGVRDLGAADLDGDGRDELLVAAGRSLTVLGAPGH